LLITRWSRVAEDGYRVTSGHRLDQIAASDPTWLYYYFVFVWCCTVKAKFHYAIWFELASNQLRTRQRNGIWWRTC